MRCMRSCAVCLLTFVHPQIIKDITECANFDRDLDDEGKEATRSLGLVVARGTLLVVISPVDGSQEIENPFAQQSDD